MIEIAAIVLAAGEGSRLGGRAKALLEIGGETFIARIVRTLREAGVERIVAVRGELEIGAPEGVDVVRNPAPERGMLSSIQCGLIWLSDAPIRGTLLWPVDCPRVPASIVMRILVAASAPVEAPVVVPSHAGRGGHPIFVPRAAFTPLMRCPLGEGARAVVRSFEPFQGVFDAGVEVLDDVDTPEDYRRIAGRDLGDFSK